MNNGINWQQLKDLTIGDILKLEKQQKGLHDIIENMKERGRFIDKQIKTGAFAEDLVVSL